MAQQSGSQGSTDGRTLVAISQQFTGPLPPPEMLQKYNETLPGLGERLVYQFESEAAHRRSLERTVVDAQVAQQGAEVPAVRLGQIFALVIVVVGLVVSGYCVSHASTSGQAWAGASIAGGSLATLAGIFIYGRKAQRPAEESKKPQA
ncbi:MAG: DUF2335 domain-containing protein [Planctomycetota bacterium]|jgi:uncharacterized membrane protein